MFEHYKSFAVIGVGNIGTALLRALSQYPDVSIIAILRKSSSAHGLSSNVQQVIIDFNEPAELKAVLEAHKVQVLVSTISGGDGLAVQKTYADAAKAAGVKLFVPSEFGMPTDHIKEGFLSVKNEVAEHCESIGLPTARYYNGYFSDFVPWLTGADESGTFYVVGKGEKPASFTSIADAVGFTAYTLTHLEPARLCNKIFRIQGTRATFTKIGDLMSGTFPVAHVDEIPSTVSAAQVRTYLQGRAELGAGSTGWSEQAQKELAGQDAAGSSNALWPEHRFETVQETLGL